PATAAAGVEILEAGGSAADAAVAACLASCVAETVMTGFLGGGHAIYWDAATGTAANLDCFCAVPSGRGGELLELDVPFGEGLVTREDLTEYEAHWSEPVEVPYAGVRFLTRAGLAPVGRALERLPPLRELDEPARTLALFDAVDGAPEAATHTTNLVAVDREGSACVLTTSLGLGSGDWLPGFDLHLN